MHRIWSEEKRILQNIAVYCWKSLLYAIVSLMPVPSQYRRMR